VPSRRNRRDTQRLPFRKAEVRIPIDREITKGSVHMLDWHTVRTPMRRRRPGALKCPFILHGYAFLSHNVPYGIAFGAIFAGRPGRRGARLIAQDRLDPRDRLVDRLRGADALGHDAVDRLAPDVLVPYLGRTPIVSHFRLDEIRP
jgi:hypothetical protein